VQQFVAGGGALGVGISTKGTTMRRLAIAGATAAVLVMSGIAPVAAQPAAGAAAFVLATLAATQSPVTGAFDALSTADQKIARALHAAQKSASATRALLTLDQIAFRKQGGLGWTEIFNIMKARGLVRDKDVRQVVSNYEQVVRTQRAVPSPSAEVVPSASP
jgi:hypothetical protein